MLSVAVITKNEARNIEDCLRSVAWAQEIVVVDEFSTDATADMAKGLGVGCTRNLGKDLPARKTARWIRPGATGS